jgi:hypothetical protein
VAYGPASFFSFSGLLLLCYSHNNKADDNGTNREKRKATLAMSGSALPLAQPGPIASAASVAPAAGTPPAAAATGAPVAPAAEAAGADRIDPHPTHPPKKGALERFQPGFKSQTGPPCCRRRWLQQIALPTISRARRRGPLQNWEPCSIRGVSCSQLCSVFPDASPQFLRLRSRTRNAGLEAAPAL